MTPRGRVGTLRPSQLLHTYGVGATVELPELTTIVLGLDDWPEHLGEGISEPRLLAAARARCGAQVAQLLTPPVVPDGDAAGVPVAPFPRWLRCPLCSLLAPLEGGLFELRPDPWRPERTSYVHAGCDRARGRRPPNAYPARYLMACEAGHLDDFPWVEFLHGDLPCTGTLRLIEVGAGGRAGDVLASCDGCGRRRRLAQALGDRAGPFLPPRCRGRHPHLSISDHDCRLAPRTLLLGASNGWFPVQLSALSIPSREGELAQAIDDAWARLHRVTSAGMLEFALEQIDDLAVLRDLAAEVGLDTVYEAIDQRRGGLDDGDPEDLLTPEWRVLCEPATAPESDDFALRPVAVPYARRADIAEVVLAERLREVSALIGFTRLAAPEDLDGDRGRVALARRDPVWLPCSEVRGEGIFLRLPEERVVRWEIAYRGSPAAQRLHEAHRAWRSRRGLPEEDGWPGERYVLLHSLAHALIRELALECGYTASSIRERIYAGDGRDGPPMAGLLLYTAAPDSEGTLGGLVSLGEPEQLGPLLRQALERAQLCSSDPLCAEHDPRGDGSVHGAACHACQFASETSCERGNRFLDRTALVTALAASGEAAGIPYFELG